MGHGGISQESQSEVRVFPVQLSKVNVVGGGGWYAANPGDSYRLSI